MIQDFKDFKGKLYTIWLVPYEGDTIFENGTIQLVTIDGATTQLLVNGHHMGLYHQPTSKESFVNIVTDSDLHVTAVGQRSLVQPET